MADDSLPYQKGPDGRLQYVADVAELPEAVVAARLTLEAGLVDVGRKLLTSGAMDKALALLEGRPPRPGPLFLLGLMYAQVGQALEARSCFERILAQHPHPLVFYELGRLHRETGFPSLATECRRKAVALDPQNTEFCLGLALDLIREGQACEGISLLKRAVAQDPLNADLHSKLLFHLHYVPGVGRQELFDEHRRWGRIHAPPDPAPRGHVRDLDPGRRLRIGYVSTDFRRHAAASTFEGLLDGRDPGAVEVHGYGDVAAPDEVTRRLTGKFDHYRDIHGLDDESVADLIEQDHIDLLVGIASHTEGHRLGIFVRKPTPIQVDYHSINTTGLSQMDYRFTDDLLDPPGSEAYCVETLVRVPQGLLCFIPPSDSPPVSSLPAQRHGSLTFGSFNKCAKINPFVLSLWAEVLVAVPGSHLVLKFAGAEDPGLQARLRGQLQERGVAPDRVRMIERRSFREHLGLFSEVDVLLDTFPFNGCMTTLEGLWMGVPTLTLAGEHFVSRMGLSILSNAGLGFFVASSTEGFVQKALALSQGLEALAQIRAALREQVAQGPLCDVRGHARSLEQAYRWMWRRWCDRQIQDQKSKLQLINLGP
jgi:protein O-GlcNAc transferase